MPDRHALTIQLNPYEVGHAAITLTDPSGQTYAGFGPAKHNMPIWPGKLDVHTVPTGTTSLPSDFSNVFGDDHRTYTVSITAKGTGPRMPRLIASAARDAGTTP